MILKVTSLTFSHLRGGWDFEDKFSGLNFTAASEASEADFGVTRPVRYLGPVSGVCAIFRCAWRHLSEQNFCGRPRLFSEIGF